MSQVLKDKVAIITGGASGIGLATAEKFSKEGAKVIIVDLNEEQGLKAELSIPNSTFVKVDVSNATSVELLVNSTVKNFGRLDIMFNNVGIIAQFLSILDTPVEIHKKLTSINYDSVFYGIKYAGIIMQKQGFGSIINTASTAALVAQYHQGSYSGTKGGIVALSRTAAVELAPSKVRVNCICPGGTDTNIMPNSNVPVPDAFTVEKQGKNLMAQIIPASAIASAVLFLASDDSQFITGIVLPIDGGLTAQ